MQSKTLQRLRKASDGGKQQSAAYGGKGQSSVLKLRDNTNCLRLRLLPRLMPSNSISTYSTYTEVLYVEVHRIADSATAKQEKGQELVKTTFSPLAF